MSQEYPFRSSALAKQSVIETNPQAFPLRDKAPSITITTTTAKPRLIEDKEDVGELTLTIVLLAAILIGFFFVLELMYPGWSVLGVMEVTNG